MKYYPTTSQLILGGIIVILLVTGLCYLWYNHTIAPYKQEVVETAEVVRQWEKNQKVDPKNMMENKTNTPAENITQTLEKPIKQTDPGLVTKDTKNTDSSEPEDVPLETPISENTDAATVSPFGFGPYPEIPEGYPLIASWTRIKEHREKFDDKIWKELELMSRVFIKLVNEGDTSFESGTFHNGLVIPVYPNVAYVSLEIDQTVEWTEDGDPIEIDSKRSRIVAGSHVSDEDKVKIRNGEIPPGIEIRSFSDGINPFEFLNLPK